MLNLVFRNVFKTFSLFYVCILLMILKKGCSTIIPTIVETNNINVNIGNNELDLYYKYHPRAKQLPTCFGKQKDACTLVNDVDIKINQFNKKLKILIKHFNNNNNKINHTLIRTNVKNWYQDNNNLCIPDYLFQFGVLEQFNITFSNVLFSLFQYTENCDIDNISLTYDERKIDLSSKVRHNISKVNDTKTEQHEYLMKRTRKLSITTRSVKCSGQFMVPLDVTKQSCPPNLDKHVPNCESSSFPKYKGIKYCEGDGECGTNTNLNNCGDFDIYIVPILCKGRSIIPLDKTKLSCPNDNPEDCDNTDLTTENAITYCEGDGECGTNDDLDNCDYGWLQNGKDIYVDLNDFLVNDKNQLQNEVWLANANPNIKYEILIENHVNFTGVMDKESALYIKNSKLSLIGGLTRIKTRLNGQGEDGNYRIIYIDGGNVHLENLKITNGYRVNYFTSIYFI